MGTNYYIYKKVDTSIDEKLHQLIDQHQYYDLHWEVKELIDSLIVHVGKSSYGWRFGFHYLDEFDKNNLCEQVMYDFIKEELDKGSSFMDEYNDPITLDEFKKLVSSKRNLEDPEEGGNYLSSTDNSRWIKGDFS